VSLVEDNDGMRETFAALLNDAPGLRCVSAHPTGEDAVLRIPQEQPDVALVDINLPGMSGIECVAKLKAQLPNLQVLMLTRYEQSDLIFNSIRAGASGYLLKKTPPAELISAIEQVHGGGAPMSMQIARKVIDHFRQIQRPASDVEKLTPREQEILELLSKGCYYKEISDKLGITMNTVRTHLQHIYEKLHVQSRTAAVLKFLGR
ncbi:MAG TPA: response regulator transcription factor, partial [Candidatus Dormibacteraeota bacterium]|nr:response regulator transcription factor [Candidatus Dormibacteraeota bacterium]